MQDLLEAFLEKPTARSYRAARRAILTDPEFRGDPGLLAEVAQLCERQRFAAADDVLARMMPDWALSPRAHGYAAWIAEELGNERDLELAQFLCMACLRGLLATGDGSRRHPYLVTHVSDEYDVASWLGCQVDSQRLAVDGARQYDVLTVEDGREYWFDVSDLLTLPRGANIGGVERRLPPPRSLRHLASSSRILRN